MNGRLVETTEITIEIVLKAEVIDAIIGVITGGTVL